MKLLSLLFVLVVFAFGCTQSYMDANTPIKEWTITFFTPHGFGKPYTVVVKSKSKPQVIYLANSTDVWTSEGILEYHRDIAIMDIVEGTPKSNRVRIIEDEEENR